MTAFTGLCAYCGDPLVGAKRSTKKYCGDVCRKAFHAEPVPDLRSAKRCQCNGGRTPGHDADGSPACQKCGAPIEGPRGPSLDSLDAIAALMEVPLHAVMRPSHEPRPSRSKRAYSTDVKVYSGAPFSPDAGGIAVLPSTAFEGTESPAKGGD